MISGEQELKQKQRTEGITFRFDTNVIKELRKEADERQISCNTLVGQIVSSHLKWNANAAKAGMVSFPKSLLMKLIEGHSEEEITEIARYLAKKEIAGIILLLRHHYSLEAFLDVVESWARASGFPLRQSVEGDKHTYVIQHDMGSGWSLYLAKVVEYVFEEIGSKKPEFHITNNTFVFKAEL